jgi:site-specific recombinase XerD
LAKITKRTIDRVRPGPKDFFVWDEEMPGFGVRVMPSGVRSYVVQYRKGSRTRRTAFSRVGIMTPEEARKHARELLVAVDKGRDPAGEAEEHRRSPTVAALSERFLAEHVAHRCKPSTQREYRRSVELFIKPNLGSYKIGDVERSNIAKLHHDMRHIPYQGNRTLGVLSKLFNLAEAWGLRPDGSNPCRHVQKHRERRRERHLSPEEIGQLGKVLADAEQTGAEPKPVINAFRLLILTGARLSEIQTLKWEYVRDGYLALPDSKTGAKRIVLGRQAAHVLQQIGRLPDNPYVIAGTLPGQHWTDLQRPWRRIRAKAGLTGVRIHDLRHTFASIAVGGGESLAIIGRLLGHSHVQTTERYAHLAPDPLRDSADRIAGEIYSAMSGGNRNRSAANSNEPGAISSRDPSPAETDQGLT